MSYIMVAVQEEFCLAGCGLGYYYIHAEYIHTKFKFMSMYVLISRGASINDFFCVFLSLKIAVFSSPPFIIGDYLYFVGDYYCCYDLYPSASPDVFLGLHRMLLWPVVCRWIPCCSALSLVHLGTIFEKGRACTCPLFSGYSVVETVCT